MPCIGRRGSEVQSLVLRPESLRAYGFGCNSFLFWASAVEHLVEKSANNYNYLLVRWPFGVNGLGGIKIKNFT